MRTLIVLCAVLVLVAAKINKAGLLCSFCESFISGIETGLINEESDIETYANQLCDLMTKGNAMLDPICKGLLDKELESIIEWLNNNEKPHDICVKLYLC